MIIKDFYPINTWTVQKDQHALIDEITGRVYPLYSKNELRKVYIGLALTTPIVHLALSVITIVLPLLRLISLYHLWKNPDFYEGPYSGFCITPRLKDMGKDLLTIVAQPFALVALEIVVLYGLRFPYDAQKLYTSIELAKNGSMPLATLFSIQPRGLTKLDLEKKAHDDMLAKKAHELMLKEKAFIQKLEQKIEAMNTSGKVRGIQAEGTEMIIDFITENFKEIDVEKFIETCLKEVLAKYKTLNLRFPLQWDVQFVVDALLEKAAIDAMEKDKSLNTFLQGDKKYFEALSKKLKTKVEKAVELSKTPTAENMETLKELLTRIQTLLKEAPKLKDDFQATLNEVAKEVQNQFIESCKKIHESLNEPLQLDSMEGVIDDEEKPTETNLSEELAQNLKLNELLVQINNSEVIEETKKALFSLELDKNLFKKIGSSNTFEKIKKQVALAINFTEYVVNGSMTLDLFCTSCLAILNCLQLTQHPRSLVKESDLLLSLYVAHLRGLYELIAAKVHPLFEKKIFNFLQDADKNLAKSLKEYVEKMNLVLGSNVEFKIEMDTNADALLAKQMQAQELAAMRRRLNPHAHNPHIPAAHQ